MFDTIQSNQCPYDTISSPDDSGPATVPLERLEAQICELAGHLAAATCRFLILLGDFDARRGWASWEMNSCAEWLSWKCQMSSGTAREHVRVARALRDLPVIRGESLCKYHHMLVHERGFLIAAPRDGTFVFYLPDGTAIPTSPPLPRPDGTIENCHDADIPPETIIPPWYGERLDLDYAIHVCFANARTEQERRPQPHDSQPEVRDRVTVYEPEDWDNRRRQYYDEHPSRVYRVTQPVPV